LGYTIKENGGQEAHVREREKEEGGIGDEKSLRNRKKDMGKRLETQTMVI